MTTWRKNTFPPGSAAAQGLASCHACGLLARMPEQTHDSHDTVCPRCDAPLHLRKPNSIARTWALVITACILYVPANVLPVMQTTTLGATQNDTILSGAAYLWNTGSWDLAIIVFIASIVVPMAKLIALITLLLSVQRRSQHQIQQRTRLYRLVEIVGKWSMLDIYVAALLATLVHFGSLLTIRTGPGAIAFGAVVVVTMFAAKSFDPRLMWDAIETQNHDRAEHPRS
ncbi:paraquat-inducible protein A [Uliginosibacterium sp. sgz301328]|uniref:paraquat-inducible protein A n=1 Tax=Uliginosibacterium sp. sgz301328 TaxID=3243764 RepID=UPI00359E64B8